MSTAEAKVNKLKVADLKAILVKASIPHSGLKKPELIAAVLGSRVALKAAGLVAADEPASNEHDEYDLPPTPVQTPAQSLGASQPAAAPSKTETAPPPLASTSATAAAGSTQTATTVPAAALPAPDKVNPQDELERRKARAARFGIPLVDEIKKTAPAAAKTPKAPAAATAPATATAVVPKSPPKPTTVKPSADDVEKLRQRAARFGIATNTPAAKAATPSKVVAAADPVEEEKKRKRAEKFGLVPGPAEKKVKTDV